MPVLAVDTMQVGRYLIQMDVDFEQCTYSCKERIELNSPADAIELDAVGLEISKVSTNSKESSWKYDAANGKLSISGDGINVVNISFNARIEEMGLHGFYKSRYNDKYLLVTQLEPNGARYVFPCFDRPDFKATFKIEVTVRKGLDVISNMPSSVEEEGDRNVFIFEETPPMSTYLLFIGIGKFVEKSLKGKPEIILACTEKQLGKEDFALGEARKSVDFFEDYFAIRYVMKKMHLVAIPDYAVGAMENWGSITFRESALLVDANSSMNEKKGVSITIAHEIAHQWFGNLVTMKWWNDLWLNESFATYMSFLAMSAIHPEWNLWSDFLLYETGGALMGDSLSDTHAIDVPVERPEEIEEIFDEISYGKGASVLRMVANYLPGQSFKKGVHRYLEQYKYSNAEGAGLWKAIEAESGVSVSEIMKKWLTQPGYPVISASRSDGQLVIKQRRFSLSGGKDETLWPLPVIGRFGDRTEKFIFDARERRLPYGDSLINLNSMQNGFYRVKYDASLLHEILQNRHKLDEKEKWGLLSDSYSFLLSGDSTLEEYMQVARAFRDESGYPVVTALLNQLSRLAEMRLKPDDILPYLREVCRTHLNRIGYEARKGEEENNASLRENLYTTLVLNDEEFASECAGRFENWDRLEPELKQAVAIGYARTHGRSALDRLLEKYRNVSGEAEKLKLAEALVSFRNEDLIQHITDRLLSGEFSYGMLSYIIFWACHIREAKIPAWKWFKENVETILKIFHGTGITALIVSTIIPGAGMEMPEEVEQFVSARTFEGAERAKAKGLELLRIYRRLMDKYS